MFNHYTVALVAIGAVCSTLFYASPDRLPAPPTSEMSLVTGQNCGPNASQAQQFLCMQAEQQQGQR